MNYYSYGEFMIDKLMDMFPLSEVLLFYSSYCVALIPCEIQMAKTNMFTIDFKRIFASF